MNKLDVARRAQILAMLTEGASMRSVSRLADVSINTVAKLLEDAGAVCAAHHYRMVQNVEAKRVQCDEIWSFCYAKQRNVPTAKAAPEQAGDVWTWTALETESKLILSWMVGDRSSDMASLFMDDLAMRLANRVQLTTDGYKSYLDAVAGAFGNNIDYAMLVKIYGTAKGNENERRYSPGECIGAKPHVIRGNPDDNHISTSFVERHNLTMRMAMKRFGRLTNAFSKKIDSHIAALSLYFYHYNWCRIHKATRVTPAMAANLTDRLWSWEEVIAELDERQKPGKRGAYSKKPLLSP